MDDKNKKRFSLIKSLNDMKEFLNILAKAENLQQLLPDKNNRSKIIEDFLNDLFTALNRGNPQLKEPQEILPSRLFTREIISELMATNEYLELHAITKNDNIRSAMGLLSIAPNLLNELNEDFETVQQIENLTERIQLLKELEKIYRQKNKPNDAKECKERCQELNKRLKKVQSEFQINADNIRVAIREVLQNSNSDLEMAIDSMLSWGNQPGKVAAIKLEQAVSLSKQMAYNPKLKDIAKKAGRLRALALRAQNEKLSGKPDEIQAIKTGSNIARVLPSEFGQLMDTNREVLFYKSYYESNLLEYEIKGRENKAMGPIVVCMDESGSMRGERDIFAKSYFLALQTIAAKQKRDLHYITFGQTIGRVEKFKNGLCPPDYLAEILTYFLGHGGTNFDNPLGKAIDIISTKSKKADIVFITDGYCRVYQQTEEKLYALKKQKGVKVFMIIIGHNAEMKDIFPLELGVVDEVVYITQNDFDIANDFFDKI